MPAQFCLIVLWVLGQTPRDNLLQNADFAAADQDRPGSWEFLDFKTGGKPLYDAQAGRDGSPAAGIHCASDEERGCWRQRIPCEAKGHLHVSGWYRTEGLRAKRGNGTTIRMTWSGDEREYAFLSDSRHSLPPVEGWTHFEHVFAVPAKAKTVFVELFDFFVSGKVWWDDMTVRDATSGEITAAVAAALERQPAENELAHRPPDASQPSANPPGFVWLPAPGAEEYVLQYSPTDSFEPDRTVMVEGLKISTYTPRETLEPGRYFWRVGLPTDAGPGFGKTRSFEITPAARPFPRPKTDEVIASIPADRPRLYFRRANLARLREEMRTKEAKRLESIARGADRRLGEELYPEPEPLPGRGQERSKAYLESFRTMRPFTSGMQECALAYIVTGERKYAEEAKRRLLHFATWDTSPTAPSGLSHNDEAAMDIAMRGPRTFDWIYDTLTDDERERCQEMLRERLAQINQMHHRMPFESRPYSSHPGRMIGFATEGAIAFAHELPEAREWLDYMLDILWAVYPAWGAADGGWAEGIGYWTAYMSMIFDPVFLLDDIGVPYKNKPFLENTGYFGLYCAPPFSKVRPFGDGHEGGVGRGQGNLLYLLSALYGDPYFRWYGEQTGVTSSTSPAGWLARGRDVEPKAPSDLPQARAFPHVGWVAMHSDLTRPKDNIHFMLKASPYGSASHSHASQNAFILNAFGEPLAIGSGYYQRYGSPHHAEWTWETKAHNSILVDGKGQLKHSLASRGRIVDFEDADGFAYATGDATEAYEGRLKRFLRHVLFVRPDYFVIYDELESVTEADYQWLLHARSEMAPDEAGQRVLISEGEARLDVRFLTPAGLKFSQTNEFDVTPEREDSPLQWHFRAETPGKSEAMSFLTALAPLRAGEAGKFEGAQAVSCTGGVACEVAGTWGKDVVIWRHEGEDLARAGDVETEARAACVRRNRNGEIAGVFALGGQSVTVGGESVAGH